MHINKHYIKYQFNCTSHIHIRQKNNHPTFKMHNHNFSEMILVVSGNGVHFHNNRFDFLLPGTFIIISPYEYHEFIETNNLNIINIGLFPSYWKQEDNLLINNIEKLQQIFTNNNDVITLNGQVFYKVQELIKWAEQEQDQSIYNNLEETNKIIYTIINQILILILRSQHIKNNSTVKNLYYKQLIKHDIIDLISLYKSSSKLINLEKYSQENGRTYNTLFKNFKDIVYISPKKVQNILKLFKAKNIILKNPDIKIQELAERLNFNDVCYFSSSFSNYFKISPQQYKKSI